MPRRRPEHERRRRLDRHPAATPSGGRGRCRGRPPHLRTWRDGWRHLRFLFLFCPRWLFLYPGLALLLVGGLGLVAGMLGQPALLGIHTLLYLAAATILGVQLIVFALLTKWLAVLAGLVPEPPWLTRAGSRLNVENGLLLGLALFVAGLVWSLRITLDWGRAGFGALDPVETMRSVIPAVTLMAGGTQVAMGSLFAGALLASWRSSRGRT